MGGGLMQLVAYGSQDIYLTGKPQITFWKSVYRRYTNFAIESIPQDVQASPLFGSQVFDINGDNLFNKEDISIIEKANKAVEKEYPDLIGGFGDYFIDKNDYFTKHMIHFDTRGYRHRYTQ